VTSADEARTDQVESRRTSSTACSGGNEVGTRCVTACPLVAARIHDLTGDDSLLLAWAPDFPSEAADRVILVPGDAGIELTDTDLARVVPNWT
jgi:hypothetical protein